MSPKAQRRRARAARRPLRRGRRDRARRRARCSSLASTPELRPELDRQAAATRASSRIRAQCTPASPLLNRATDGLFIPGSTFKVITAVGRAGQRPVHARVALRRPRLLRGVRQAGRNAGNPEAPRDVRQRRLHPGARALDQLGLLQHRQGARRGRASSTRRSGSASTSCRRWRRPANERQASGLYHNGAACSTPEAGDPGRPGPARLRPGADGRDAAADGDGRAPGSPTAAS